jgi:hypothetical protein
VVQNSAPYRDLGAATPVHQQAGRADRWPPRRYGQCASRLCLVEYGNPPAGRTPAQITHAFGDALPPVYGYLAPLLAVAVALAIAWPEKPLRGRAHLAADEARLDEKTTSRTARSRHAEGIG